MRLEQKIVKIHPEARHMKISKNKNHPILHDSARRITTPCKFQPWVYGYGISGDNPPITEKIAPVRVATIFSSLTGEHDERRHSRKREPESMMKDDTAEKERKCEGAQ